MVENVFHLFLESINLGLQSQLKKGLFIKKNTET